MKLTQQRLYFALVCLWMCGTATHAFITTSPVVGRRTTASATSTLLPRWSSPDNNNNNNNDREQRLKSLGYSDDEIAKRNRRGDNASSKEKEEQKVRVDLIEDVDPLTLTALGFGAIAFNFLVLGNLGDGGIGGLVATAINLMNQ